MPAKLESFFAFETSPNKNQYIFFLHCGLNIGNFFLLWFVLALLLWKTTCIYCGGESKIKS